MPCVGKYKLLPQAIIEKKSFWISDSYYHTHIADIFSSCSCQLSPAVLTCITRQFNANSEYMKFFAISVTN